MSQFQLYQRVRVARLLSEHTNDLGTRGRVPIVGDVGAVVHVYSHPQEAYCVECVGSDGGAVWLSDFLPAELVPDEQTPNDSRFHDPR